MKRVKFSKRTLDSHWKERENRTHKENDTEYFNISRREHKQWLIVNSCMDSFLRHLNILENKKREKESGNWGTSKKQQNQRGKDHAEEEVRRKEDNSVLTLAVARSPIGGIEVT